MISTIRKIYRIGWLRSIILNFKLLPLRQAVKLPIIVSKSTRFNSLKGKGLITCKPTFGLVRIGFVHSDFVHWNEMKNFLNINGTVHFGGRINFGVGTKLIVDKGAHFEIGNNASIGYDFKVICRKRISIGQNFRAAWNVQIFDTNFHYVKDTVTGEVKKKNNIVILGDNNWVGNRSSVMPGTVTPDYFIAASNSLLNKNYCSTIQPHSLVAGSPAKLLREHVIRVLDKEEKELDQLFLQNIDHVIVDPTPRTI